MNPTPNLLALLFLTLLSAFAWGNGAALAEEAPVINKLADASRYFAGAETVILSGEVNQVIYWQYTDFESDPGHAIVLGLEGREGQFLAYMGPKKTLRKSGHTFEPGDRLSIEGVLGNVEGQIMLLGQYFTRGEEGVALREGDGTLAVSR
ncbi:MAG: hypothetical protein P1P84_11155 [Deferrisomatales bacterium]|nr:hypothetical protein [Deferrisomatales bacterium]